MGRCRVQHELCPSHSVCCPRQRPELIGYRVLCPLPDLPRGRQPLNACVSERSVSTTRSEQLHSRPVSREDSGPGCHGHSALEGRAG